MARVTTQAIQLAHKGIDNIVVIGTKNAIKPYEAYTAEEPDNNSEYVRNQVITNLPSAVPVGQDTGIPIYDWQTPFYQDTTFTKRGLGIGLSSEAMERDIYGCWKRPAKDMTVGMNKAMRADMAGFINLGSTSITTPDGIALFSASHKLAVGVASNVIASNQALDIFTLETSVQDIMAQVDHFGDPIDYDGTFSIVVGPALAMLARRLVYTNRAIPQSNDNDDNVVGGYVTKVIVDNYITSNTMYTLVPNMKDDNPLKRVIQRAPRVNDQEIIVNDSYVWVMTSIWLKYAQDWRNVGQSSGLG